jgi:hypothetical protein
MVDALIAPLPETLIADTKSTREDPQEAESFPREFLDVYVHDLFAVEGVVLQGDLSA